MKTLQFITDKKGKKLSGVLPLKDYKKIMGELEELEDIRHYDEATESKETSIPIDKAFKLIETKRKNANPNNNNLIISKPNLLQFYLSKTKPSPIQIELLTFIQ